MYFAVNGETKLQKVFFYFKDKISTENTKHAFPQQSHSFKRTIHLYSAYNQVLIHKSDNN